MGGVKQSGVTTALPPVRPSVCHRLRTGTHSSHRKVRASSVQLLHSPSIRSSIFPPIHPSLPSPTGGPKGRRHSSWASSYLLPPLHFLFLYPPRKAPSPFNHLLPVFSHRGAAGRTLQRPTFSLTFFFFSQSLSKSDTTLLLPILFLPLILLGSH